LQIGELCLLFHYPKLSDIDLGIVRSPGPGLGNLLFPIARALIGEKSLGGVFVHPTIRQLKVGTYLRGEKDKRTYGGVIRSRSREEWAIWVRAMRSRKFAEGVRQSGRDLTICYSGLRAQFHDIWPHAKLIEDWLDRNSIQGVMPPPYDVAVHVRQGDFRSASTRGGGRSIRQPPEWYREAVARAGQLLQTPELRIRLFTDGDATQVARDLGLPGMAFDESPNALTAIKTMSRARLIITSRSSFSMWAAFLSGAPAIWDKRMDLSEVFPVRKALDHFV
jgi:hypothetical protein